MLSYLISNVDVGSTVFKVDVKAEKQNCKHQHNIYIYDKQKQIVTYADAVLLNFNHSCMLVFAVVMLVTVIPNPRATQSRRRKDK